jgi:hypothetical protein
MALIFEKFETGVPRSDSVPYSCGISDGRILLLQAEFARRCKLVILTVPVLVT